MAPVFSSTKSIFCQVLPPSVDLKTPRSGLGANTCPIEEAYTTLGSCGSTTIVLVVRVSRKPAYFHVLPASTDLKTPSPVIMSLRMSGSPVPTYSTLGLEGATAMAPMLSLADGHLPSVMFCQVTP